MCAPTPVVEEGCPEENFEWTYDERALLYVTDNGCSSSFIDGWWYSDSGDMDTAIFVTKENYERWGAWNSRSYYASEHHWMFDNYC